MLRPPCVCLGAILVVLWAAPGFALSSVTPFSLSQALTLAEKHHPQLYAAEAEIRARQSEMGQALARPNPSLELEVENIVGSGQFSGGAAAETRLMLNQPLELGSKPELRHRGAVTAVTLAQRQRDIVRTVLSAQVARSFLDLLAAQERQAVAAEQVRLAHHVREIVRERIVSGRAPATDAISARMAVAEQELAFSQSAHELSAARQQLALLLGINSESLAVRGNLMHLPALPSLVELERQRPDSPLQHLQRVTLEQRHQELAQEQARAIPDLELGVGVRHTNDGDDTALIIGLSLPLPLFNRNQATIAAARHRLSQSEAEQRNADLEQRAALVAAHSSLANSRQQATILSEHMLPAAKEVCDVTEYGYRAGKFPLAVVLDARRDLLELRQRYFATLVKTHLAAIDLQSLLGLPANVFSLENNQK